MTETLNFLIETPIFEQAVPGPNGTDVLSDVLRVFRVTGAALLRGEFSSPWAWETPPASTIANLLHPGATRLIIFHIVAEGSCWFEIDGEKRCMLAKGDIVGFPQGTAHRMGNGRTHLIPLASLLPPPPWHELPVLASGGGGETTKIVCIYLRCDSLLFDPFIDSLPKLLIVRRDRVPSGQWVDASVQYLISEAVKGRPGTSCIMARLTELLFVEILRLHLAQVRERDVGWFAALRDRHVCRVLNAFHSEPAKQWTVEMLSREVRLSRSALARRFHQLLDMSPMQYLATWRLHLAAQDLKFSDVPIKVIADRIGYDSEEAFSRAFKRHFGLPPSDWRRRQAS
jgi:AraC family transcriptional regulator, alkane utilization regulator